MVTIAIASLGEMGLALAQGLGRSGHRVVTSSETRSPRTRERAATLRSENLPTLAQLVDAADVVISCVPPGAATGIASEISRAARRAPRPRIYVDVNSIAPTTARDIAAKLPRELWCFSDAAIHGTAAELGARSVLYASGPGADAAIELLSPVLATSHLGAQVGSASAFKMLLSSVSKSLAALLFEAGTAAGALDALPRFLDALQNFYPGIVRALERTVPSYPRHAPRRAQELRQIESLLAELGVEAPVIAGTSRSLARLAASRVCAPEASRTGSIRDVLESVNAAAVFARPRPSRGPVPTTGGPMIAQKTTTLGVVSDKTRSGDQRPQSAELLPGPGFRIRVDVPRLDTSRVARLREFDVSTISDQLNRLYAMDARIALLTAPSHQICGLACTVRVYPGDNLMVHKALDVAKPGDIVAIDAQGSKGGVANAALGDIICTKAKHRGIAGFVVDGAVRDLPGILELDLPVFARGTTAVGPLHRGPGEINYPIACGGVVIQPGDAVVGDRSGIVVVPREIVAELIERLEARRESAASYLAAVRRGEFSNAWVDAQLRNDACPISDEGSARASEIERAALVTAQAS